MSTHHPGSSIRRVQVTLTSWLVTAVFALVGAPSMAQVPLAQPLIKQGSCPSGYHSSGNYCTPSSPNARAAPSGLMPLGLPHEWWLLSG